MKIKIQLILPLTTVFFLLACTSNQPKEVVELHLEVVTYEQFEEFVDKTGYVTDAEKFGWSIVQQDVYNFITEDGANWKKPDGINSPDSKDLPVTQVSYNDAMAYCEWTGTRLPTYQEYWELIKDNEREVITNNNAPISDADQVNILGNVWELTSSERGGICG